MQEGWNRWRGEVVSQDEFRSSKRGDAPFAKLPFEVRSAIGDRGEGALGVVGSQGPAVIPVRWLADGGALCVAVPLETLALADAGPEAPVALTIDRTSAWRARDMIGAMVQGTGSLFALPALNSGARSLKTVLKGIDPERE